MTLASLSELMLIPFPRAIQPAAGACSLRGPLTIRLLAGVDEAEVETARLLARTVQEKAGIEVQLRASPAPAGQGVPDILLAEEETGFSASPEAYRLTITPQRVTVGARTAQGRFYGAQTLRQLLQQYGAELPAMRIEDAPALAQRGVMLDISRGKVPRLETLKGLTERFAALKYNQLQLYVEHTFAFERHPLLGAGHSPLTPEDILALDEHCRRLHIALVPNLQSFGHVSHTLEHGRYRHLAESDFRGGWTLSPAVAETYDFLAELYAEYLPLFSHRPYFNVDCDETWDLGKGLSKERAEREGLGRVYLEHLLKVRRLIEPYGCRMLCWGDILEQHPELIGELPRDVILLNWHYEGHGQEERCLKISRPAQEAGVEHWACPGTSGWLSFFFRKANSEANMREWARVAAETGAGGYLLTDWGDEGHLNCLSNSYWGFAFGAEGAWNSGRATAAGPDFDRRFLATILPGAPEGWLEALQILGNQYQVFEPSNGAPNFIQRALLTGRFERLEEGGGRVHFFFGRNFPVPSAEELQRALEISEQAIGILEEKNDLRGELDLVRREWLAGARLGACACQRALAFLGRSEAGGKPERDERLRQAIELMDEVWHERNRESDWPAQKKILTALLDEVDR